MSRPMDSGRWEAIRTVFDELIELDVAERGRRLAAIGATDPELRDAVEALLHADAEAGERLAPIEAALFGPGSSTRGATADPLERLKSTLADRYRFEKELGRGGMATVYLAEDLKHHRKVAVKVLDPQLAAVLGSDRFLREIEISAKLNHPHILPLLDSGDADGFLFYAMPYAEGESLRDRLRREKQLPVEDALQIAREVADALDYAHRHDVVHRDIKPENILLEERHAVVADFGIARAITVVGGEKLTATGAVVGTPEYMSPEQAGGSRELDGRTDIYALGCVLYEMLAGRPPFTGPTVESVVHQHLTAPPPAVTAIRAAVPAPVTKAIEYCLAKAPADRYATASQLAQALGPRPVPGTAGGRWPALAAAGLALAVLAAAGSWLMGRTRGASSNELPRLAVLPFENLGPAEDEFFADGITEEIMTKLAGLSGLAVISSQSAMGYKGTTKSTGDIGRELHVQYLLQGTIRWQRLPDGSSRVRVTPRLIQVADDRHLWASDYDQVLADVFRVQGQIALQVANALQVTLVRREEEAVTRRPTENLAAYEQYLKGNGFFRVGFPYRPPIWDAARAYEQAVALDPDFAAAHARLSMAHGGIRQGNLDPGRGDQHLAKQKEHAERALALDPALPEAHLAMGRYHYWGQGDYETALQEFGIALVAEPNNSLYIQAQAAIYKRTGNWEAAAERSSRASDLDPLSSSPAAEAGYPLIFLRRYAEAERYLERYATLTGEYSRLAYVHLLRDGDPAALRAWVDATLGPGGFAQFIATAAHATLNPWPREIVRVLCGECDAAIPLVPSLRERDWQRYRAIALLHERAGRLDQARLYYDSARVGEESVSETAHPVVYAKLGNKAKALATVRENLERNRRNRDVFAEAGGMRNLAEVYVLVGEYEAALEQLDWLLSHPSDVSVPLLRADPLYDPLRSNPRFQALLATYGTARN